MDDPQLDMEQEGAASAPPPEPTLPVVWFYMVIAAYERVLMCPVCLSGRGQLCTTLVRGDVTCAVPHVMRVEAGIRRALMPHERLELQEWAVEAEIARLLDAPL